MEQIKNILKRLKNPSVVISIVSQVAAILALLNVSVNVDVVTQVVVGISSILVLLGIMSDPTTENKGYGDDMKSCPVCGKMTSHIKVGEKALCSQCGNEVKEEEAK